MTVVDMEAFGVVEALKVVSKEETVAQSCNADVGRSLVQSCCSGSCARGVCHMCRRPGTFRLAQHCRIMAIRPARQGLGTQCFPPD